MEIDFASERAYPTPYSNSPLLPLLLLVLAKQKHAPDGATRIKTEYDYIIVGAGSAGSVVANRLSEVNCVSVLLLEAGKRPPLLTDLPVLSFEGTDIDWQYRTTPQKHTGFNLINREVIWPSGKALGGSSILNAMLYVRGNRKNYDDWEAQGATGWSYEDVLSYFKKMEDNRDIEYLENGYHGFGGPVTVQKPRYEFETKNLIFEAGKQLGYEVVDPNGYNQTGFYAHQATMRDGQRCSTAKAYLVPAENRENLDILPNAVVRKIIIQHRRARGVIFDVKGYTFEVKARKEVILSAGAVNSPQLLMLSGVGPRTELEKHNISVIADLPVGKNLQDHCGSGMSFIISPKISLEERNISNPQNIARYIEEKKGPLAALHTVSALAFLHNNTRKYPNYQILFQEGLSGGRGLKREIIQQLYLPYIGEMALSCFAVATNPRSRGTVTLRSRNPYDPPVIDPNYLEDHRDVEDIVEGLKMCKRIGASEPLRRVDARPMKTLIPGCEQYAGNDDLYLECHVRSHISTLIHPTGTAKMGNLLDPSTVVDPQLRVKGIRGLRVVDASIMPIIPSGNTNIPTIMLAEKASDIIKGKIECSAVPFPEEELLNLYKLEAEEREPYQISLQPNTVPQQQVEQKEEMEDDECEEDCWGEDYSERNVQNKAYGGKSWVDAYLMRLEEEKLKKSMDQSLLPFWMQVEDKRKELPWNGLKQEFSRETFANIPSEGQNHFTMQNPLNPFSSGFHYAVLLPFGNIQNHALKGPISYVWWWWWWRV